MQYEIRKSMQSVPVNSFILLRPIPFVSASRGDELYPLKLFQFLAIPVRSETRQDSAQP
jgi:hypothetical protein